MVDQAETELQARVELLRGLANAAIANPDPAYMDAINLELGKDVLNSAEVGILQGFVQGAITEQQFTQLIKTAQVETDAGLVLQDAVNRGIVDAEQATIIAKASLEASAPETAGKISEGGKATDSRGEPVGSATAEEQRRDEQRTTSVGVRGA